MVSITADKNTVAVVVPMTTVMSFNIVSGPVNPVSIKSGAVEPVAVVRVLVGVPVGMSYLKVPPGMMSHALFPRLGGDMVEGGPVRAIPGGPSLGETQPPSQAWEKRGPRPTPHEKLTASFPGVAWEDEALASRIRSPPP